MIDNEHVGSVQRESEQEEFKRDNPIREDDEITVENIDMIKARLTIEKDGFVFIDYSMDILASLVKDVPGVVQSNLEDLSNKVYEMLIK